MSRHDPRALCPLHFASRLHVSVLVFTLSCCATCGRRGGPWCCGLASILSPFPLENIEGRSLLASAPINLQRAHSHP